jgi:hypothetical protein
MFCQDCGAAVEGGTVGCEALLQEVVARDFSDSRYIAVHLVKPEPPGLRGRVTVVDVRKAADLGEHKELVHEWAKSVWQAWSEHHKIARQWIGRATGR